MTTAIDPRIQEALAEFEDLAQRAPDLISILEGQRHEIDEQIRRLKSLVRAVNPPPPPPSKRTRVSRTVTSNGAGGVERAKRVRDAILALDKETFTALEIRDQMGQIWSEPTFYNTFAYLREREFLAKQGKDPESKRDIWVVLDRDARLEPLGTD